MSKYQIGRDAGTGRLITVREALRRPKTTVIETMNRPARPAATKPKAPSRSK